MNHAKLGTAPGGNPETALTREPAKLIADLTDALHASEAAFRAIGDIAPLGVFVNDEAGRPKYVNDELLDILDLSREHAEDRWAEAIHPDDRERVRREWADCMQAHKIYRSRHRFVRRDGEIVFTEVVAAPFLDRNGHVGGVAGTVQNVTSHNDKAKTELAL